MASGAAGGVEADSGVETCNLSVVLRVVGGGDFLRKCLEALTRQIQGKPVEIIVPYDATVAGVESLKHAYPQVRFSEMEEERHGKLSPGEFHELYDRRTAAGLRIARGKICALLEDYGIPGPDWCDQVLLAHQLPYPAIGGAVEHHGRGILNWAVYLLDFGRYQLPLLEGPAEYLTDVNISYKKKALERVKEVWMESYNEIRTNWALARSGMTLWRRPQIIVWQDRGRLTWRAVLAERFYWGRIFGRARLGNLSSTKRFLLIAATPVMPLILVSRVAMKVFTDRRNRFEFLKALAPMLALALFWCLGESAGYVNR